MLELPSHATRAPRGTLIVDDEVLLVYLSREGAGPGPVDPRREPEENPDIVIGPDDEPPHDNPVIGIYQYSYALRDVPAGRSLALRDRPDRSARPVGSLRSNARSLQIEDCVPYIDSLTFMEASRDRQLGLLSAGWCHVGLDGDSGWVPGRYLMPEQPR